MTGLGMLMLASATFVGTYFMLSYPLRAPLVAKLGEKGFGGLYMLVALATFAWVIWAFGPASAEAPQPLWDVNRGTWLAATLLMWMGSILFMNSLLRNPALILYMDSYRRNPALPRPGKSIVRVIGWWLMVVHAIVNPTPASLVLSTTFALLALVGAALQDEKKARLLGDIWDDWLSETSFYEHGLKLKSPTGFVMITGTLLLLVTTWAHGALGYRPAGIWAFFV